MPPRSTRTPRRRRVHDRFVDVELERRQSGANRHVERAAREIEHVTRDDEALQRRRRHPRALTSGQVVDPRDVAVGQKPAQLALEPIDEIESTPAPPAPRTDGCHARVDLVDGGHRLVREAADVAEIVRLRELHASVDLRALLRHSAFSIQHSASHSSFTSAVPSRCGRSAVRTGSRRRRWSPSCSAASQSSRWPEKRSARLPSSTLSVNGPA